MCFYSRDQQRSSNFERRASYTIKMALTPFRIKGCSWVPLGHFHGGSRDVMHDHVQVFRCYS